MDLKRRFKLFGFGIVLGIILSFFFFEDRLGAFTDWMPGERIKLRLRSTYVGNSEEVDAMIKANNWPDTLARSFMWEGEVMLGESKTRSEPKVYILDYDLNGRPIKATFVATDSTAVLRVLE